LEGNTAGDGLDFVEIYTDFNTGHRHISCSNLKPEEVLRREHREKYIPTTRSSAKIDKSVGTVEEIVFTIELDKLEGSSGTVTLFLSDVIPFIKSGL